jgi:hypothetical protein
MSKYNELLEKIMDDRYQFIDLIIKEIYDLIPEHDIYEVAIHVPGINKVLSEYAALYSILSKAHSWCIVNCKPRQQDRIYYLKQVMEQALKVIKFQYETLSRRLTIEKDENFQWSGKQEI